MGHRAGGRQIAQLALPALGVLAAEPLYLLFDIAVVGRLGAISLAGLAIGSLVLGLVGLWPLRWYPQNYRTATEQIPFWTFLRNSLIITSVLAVVKFTLGVLSAFGLVFVRFPGRTAVFLVIIAALMVPNQITVISNYALISHLGLRNTFAGIILPLAGVAFGTFLMRNHFLSLPAEIIEAARMDGARWWQLLLRVVLPMSRPTMVAVGVITVVNEWNEYLWPFLMSDDESVAPLPIGLTFLQQAEGVTNWGPVMAVTLLAMLPILLVFIALQRQMIKGLTSGAVKG